MAESVTRFGAVDENFSKTISTMEGRLEGFNASVVATSGKTIASTAAFVAATAAIAAFAAGVAIASGYAAAFKTAMDFAEKIMDLKQRTGELASNLVILQRAFENSGLKADQVGPAIFRLQKVIGDAAAGSGKAQEKLAGLGLSLADLQNLSPSEQLQKVAEAIAKIEDPARRNSELIRIFGQDLGPKMAPLVNEFVGQMERAKEQLGSFPRIVGQYGPVLDELKQNLDNLKNKFLEFAFGAVGPLADIFKNLTERLLNFDAAGFGEKIGLEFRKALVAALIFIEDMTFLLGGIWDGMKDTVQPILNEIRTYFQGLAEQVRPYIEKISEFFRNLDYRAIGQRIGEQFAYALQVARGLLADPSQIFGLYGRYLDFTFRKAADDLVSFFVTALEAVGRFLVGIFSADFWGGIATIFVNAMIMGTAQIGLHFLEMLEGTMRAFTSIWDAVTGEGVTNFAKRLYDLVKNFGSDLLMALTNPLGFFTGKLASALLEGTKEGANAYETNFDTATGNFIAKAKAGLQGMSTEATANMAEGFAQATSALTTGLQDAVTKTEGFKSNLFGSAEAGERLRAATDKLAENGRSLLGSAQEAATEIETVNKDLKVTADLYTGPSGIATVTERAAQNTQAASERTATAFQGVAQDAEQVKGKLTQGGNEFYRVAVDAGRTFKQEVIGSLSWLTDSFKGIATEGTLRRAVASLERLERKLPQPALT